MALPNSWTMLSDDQWRIWLEDEIGKQKKVFLTDPDRMKSAFNQERSSARDYYGRELLELLQNADDAGAAQKQNNKVLIELDDQILYVANTGQPFSPAGIKSLMVSDNSPKQLSRTHYIGYKGLGFRSVLGWASKIAIFSGNLKIGFSEGEAIRIAEELGERNNGIKQLNNQFVSETQSYPMAVLSCPFWINDDYTATDQLFQIMTERCRSIIGKGYDTCIGFILKTPNNTREKVISQISSLGKELLIFSNYLDEVNIQSKEINIKWQAIRQDSNVIVSSDNGDISLWEVFYKTDSVPAKYISPGQPKEMHYEIKVAIPDNGVGSDFLYVYFPTQVNFPFPVVAHATFELASNRQHIIESDINRFLCTELASVMSEMAEKSVDPNRPWKALSIVSPTATIDPVLTILGFNEQLILSCAKKKIIPVRGNTFLESNSAKTIRGNFDKLLSSKDFSDLILWTDDIGIQEQMKNLGITSISQTVLNDRINDISSSLSLEKRAKIVFGLVDNELIEAGKGPKLLLDQDKRLIPSGVTAFLPPEGATFNIPDWVPLRFVNSELASLIASEFGISNVRDLARLLKGFGVQEYNLASIVSAILTKSNDLVELNPADELSVRQRTVAAIFAIYNAISPDQTTRLDKVVVLPTRTGQFLSANQLYFGGEYGCGKLMDALLGKACPDCFIARPEVIGVTSQPKTIESFLRWLGVEYFPRETKLNSSPNIEFRDAVLTALKYPAHFGVGEFTMNTPDEIRGNSCSLSQLSSFDHLEDILKTSDPHAILAWLAIDRRQSLVRNNDENGWLCILPSRYRDRRILSHQSILAYPMWLFRNAEWLPTPTGLKAPLKCSVAHGLSKELWSIISTPVIVYDHSIFSVLGIDRNSINSSLAMLGVSNDLNDLSWDTFYEILMNLPETDPKGTTARSLYRTFVTRDEPPVHCLTQEKFFKTGKMFGKHGTESGFFPVEQLYYLDNFTLPEHIARFFPLLELDKRRGATKVKNLFNVTSLAADEIQTRINVTNYEVHPWADPLQDDLERLKPYIYALRVEYDSDRSEPPTLKRLEIKLCRSVKATVEINASNEVVELRPGDSIVEGHIVYLVGEPRNYESSYLSDVIVADAVGEIVASLLKVESLKSDIARLATCPPEMRGSLLDRMTGGTGTYSLAIAAQALNTTVEPEIPLPTMTQVPIPATPTPPTPNPLGTPASSEPHILPPKKIGAVTVAAIDIPTTTVGAERKRGLVVSPNPTPPRRRRLVDPDRSENMAFQFEIEQGRFPKKVGHLRGMEGFGCDLLSFETEEVRLTFETGRDISTVLRFIEVKGKVSDRGSIEIKGNELASAKKYKGRYYLYRVYEDDENQGLFELVELADPIGVSEAVKIVYEVNPFRTTAKICWNVRELIVEDEGSSAEV